MYHRAGTLPVMGRPRTTRTSDQVTIRLPDGMRDEINRIAAENGRSANAEIVLRLQRSLDPALTPEVMAIRDHFDRALEDALNRIGKGSVKKRKPG